MSVEVMRSVIDAAEGRVPVDTLFTNAQIVDVYGQRVAPGSVAVKDGVIVGVLYDGRDDAAGTYEAAEVIDCQGRYLAPGFIDGHLHIESSNIRPAEYARMAATRGTTTAIADSHEIANVAGLDGLRFMIEDGHRAPISIKYMMPSCVPALPDEQAGAVITAADMQAFFAEHPGDVFGLGEMMNLPGVFMADPETCSRIDAANQTPSKQVDGHAPLVAGKDLNAYIAAGVYSDHECSDMEDAMNKLRLGQYIMIREGTAARNLEALMPLLTSQYVDRCMFCTDDKHPNDLLEKGHIDYIVKKAISLGADPIVAVKAACHNAARYFLLNNRGAIAPGYLGDFVIIDDFQHFEIEMVYKRGVLMYDGQLRDFPAPEVDPYLVKRAHDTFHVAHLTAEDFSDGRPHAVIGMIPGEIVTQDAGYADHADPEQDILKIAVIERHKNTHHIGLGYIKGYGLKRGAVATSISHDSHNIIVVGATDEDMAAAANRIVENRGGITVMENGQVLGEVTLSIAGIMSDDSLVMVNSALEDAKDEAFGLGVSRGIDPFMTLSFMALPVIPSLRITTRGVFDVSSQRYI